jgi:hypothetical protein
MLDEVIIARMEAMIRVIFTRIDISGASPLTDNSGSALPLNKIRNSQNNAFTYIYLIIYIE